MFKVIINSSSLTYVPAEEVPMGSKPILQFNLCFDVYFLSLNMKALSIPTLWTHVTHTTFRLVVLVIVLIVFTSVLMVSTLVLVILTIILILSTSLASKKNTYMLPKIAPLPNYFEICSSSKIILMTKSQR